MIKPNWNDPKIRTELHAISRRIFAIASVFSFITTGICTNCLNGAIGPESFWLAPLMIFITVLVAAMASAIRRFALASPPCEGFARLGRQCIF